MSIILAVWTLLFPASDRIEALRSSAPKYLTADTAQAHWTASQVAAIRYELEPELLLAIAYRESRYTVDAVGPTVQGKRACGVMQPLMKITCQKQTLLEGYMIGAQHLRTWLDTKTCRGDLRCAMLGYSGGYSLLKTCAAGPLMVERGGRQVNLCTIPDVTFARARQVRGNRRNATARRQV